MNKYPLITARYVPPVSGVDLEHALNYADSDGIDLEWFYTSFTRPQVFYRKGSRPFLEELVQEVLKSSDGEMKKMEMCLEVMVSHVKHFSKLGYEGSTVCGRREEEILQDGCGWCNEQARVFLALTQVVGIPSRLVFAGMTRRPSHVLSETFVEAKWVLVDQTESFVFRKKDGSAVNVMDFKGDPAVWMEVNERYRQRLQQSRSVSVNPLIWDKIVPYGIISQPLELFSIVGYHNYFIH